jgi:hypothetical protein
LAVLRERVVVCFRARVRFAACLGAGFFTLFLAGFFFTVFLRAATLLPPFDRDSLP